MKTLRAARTAPEVRVLFLLDSLATGGAERNVLALAGALDQLGADCSVCTLNSLGDGFLASEVVASGRRRFDLKVRRFYDPRGAFRFGSLLRKERFDVVHIEDPYCAPLGFVAKQYGIPVVFTQHVIGGGGAIRDRIRTSFFRVAVSRTVDQLIAVSEAVAADYVRLTRFDKQRVAVVHNGISLSSVPAIDRALARRALGWSADELIVLMVGVMRPGKGHAAAVEAFALAREVVPGARLILAGDGPLRSDIEAMSRPLDNAVVSLGDVSNVLELMLASDVLILPSDSEAYPTVLVEAACCGLPVIATHVGGIPEVVVHGETGFCVPQKEVVRATARELTTVLRDEALRKSMSSRARAHAKSMFAIERQAEATMALYRRLLDDADSTHIPAENRYRKGTRSAFSHRTVALRVR